MNLKMWLCFTGTEPKNGLCKYFSALCNQRMLGHKHGDGNITATFIIFNGDIMLSEEENDVCWMHL